MAVGRQIEGDKCREMGVPGRAPEILLGQDAYTEAVDMWAVGCIFGELLRNEPLFPAKGEAETLVHHTRLLGRPNDRIWPVCGRPAMGGWGFGFLKVVVEACCEGKLTRANLRRCLSLQGYSQLPFATSIILPDQPYNFVERV